MPASYRVYFRPVFSSGLADRTPGAGRIVDQHVAVGNHEQWVSPLKYFLWLIFCASCTVVAAVDSTPAAAPFNYLAYPVLLVDSRTVDVVHEFSFKRQPD